MRGAPLSRRDRIRAQLADLKMPGALESLDEILSEIDAGAVTAAEAIERVLGAQIALRNARRLEAAMRSSRLPAVKTLAGFDFAFQPSLKREQIESLHELGFVERKENVVFLGPPGVGKSHLCVGLGVKAVQLGFSVQHFRFDELMAALRADAGMPPARLKRRKYMSTALLLVDELGFEPMTRQEASLFFRLVSYRYGRGAMLITTNKSIRDWTELLAGDEVLAAAILDRLLHRAHVLNIKGRSYRLRDLEDALKLAHA